MSGKGDKARNCHSRKFRDNFDLITWSRAVLNKKKKTSCKSRGKTIKYY